MKRIFFTLFFPLILGFAALLVGINNYFFYKNEEKQTLMQMEREVEQLHGILLACDEFKDNCDRLMKAFIKTSSINGKILLKKNNASIYTQNLEKYKDDRSPVQYSTKFQVGKNIFNLYFEKKVTPSILVSVFKSMTFSVTEWKQASLNFSSYKNLENFITTVAIPRSRPAFFYLAFIGFIFGIIYTYIQYILKRWDKLEKHNKHLTLLLKHRSEETRKYQEEVELLNLHSTQIASELKLTQKQLSEILIQKSLLEEQKQEIAKEIENQITQLKTQQEYYQHQRETEIKNLLKSL